MALIRLHLLFFFRKNVFMFLNVNIVNTWMILKINLKVELLLLQFSKVINKKKANKGFMEQKLDIYFADV